MINIIGECYHLFCLRFQMKTLNFEFVKFQFKMKEYLFYRTFFVKLATNCLKKAFFTVASLHQKKKQVNFMLKTLDRKPVKLDNRHIRP